MNLSDEEIKKMYNALEKHIEDKNTLTVDEFEEFIPLFNKELIKDMSEEEINALCDKYGERVDMFHPVKIVDHHGNVVVKLPAMFVRTTLLNEFTNKDNVNVMDVYTRAMAEAENPVSMLPVKATAKLKETIVNSIYANSDEFQQQLDEYVELADNLEKIKQQNDKKESTQEEDNVSLDDFEWE